MKKSKGISALSFSEILTAIFAIGAIALVYFLFFGKYLDLNIIVESNEVERHAIDSAQLLMSSKRLIYSESVLGDDRYHRGIFEKTKLDLVPIEYLEDIVGYPNSASSIEIKNLETGESWEFAVVGPSGYADDRLFSCIDDISDIVSCWKTHRQSKVGTFEKTFPVLIRENGNLYNAHMTIQLTEGSVLEDESDLYSVKV